MVGDFDLKTENREERDLMLYGLCHRVTVLVIPNLRWDFFHVLFFNHQYSISCYLQGEEQRFSERIGTQGLKAVLGREPVPTVKIIIMIT